MVGGCCGTTAEHVRQMKAAVRAAAPGRPRAARAATPDGQAEPMPPVERRGKSALARTLAEHRFAVVTEVAAPRGLDLSAAVAYAQRLHALGASAVAITDYPKSAARVSALALGVLLQQRGPVETLLHYSCRDRNLIGMQSDLLGAHAMGVRNVLLTTGEAPRQGSVARSVFDVDAIGLVNMVAQLNRGLDVGGQSLGAPTAFHVGVAVNPFSPTPEVEWRRLDYKVDAGAEYLMTPPILDLDALDRALPRLRQAGLPILAGVVALESVRQAEFLASEVPGIQMPDRLLARLRSASDPAAEGLAITRELVGGLRERVQGVHITGLHGSGEGVERLLGAEVAAGARSRS
jgi:homocysteine S-methyltransferase